MSLNWVCYTLLALALIASFFFTHSLWMGLLFITLLTFLLYGADKLAARKGWRRVPETTLLVFGLVGGWIGAFFGQQLFRHKTQKQPFRTWFMLSVAVNIVAVAGAGYWMYGRWIL
ncbi:DUF1294 domain-containing protein [Buttiauxella warmboldiae]|uniref:DUF1294 domain-containing protein n=1 Tax=Buttiauxella warmboldiae TaxID=82993 RepID=A0A3N5DJX5_9ENTR|nr:DUF1294 domain-containing protein [Buttiauxella warmboldiae]RPH29104.1 DUF1294 domain-containing protein [Buttiauxella warmboldiae]